MAEIITIFKSWTQLKTFLIAPKSLQLQYTTNGQSYYIFTIEAGQVYFTELWIDTSLVEGIDVTQNNIDLTDFETNYKSSANQPIDQPINFSGTLVNDSINPRYSPRFLTLKTPITITSQTVDTEIANIDFDGQLSAISLNFNRDDIEITIEVDGVEILTQLNLKDLNNNSIYDLMSATGDDD